MAGLLLVWGRPAPAQTADDIVERYLAALGGRAALERVKSRSMTGTIVLSTPAGDVSGTIVVLSQAPNKERTLITLDLSALGAGQVTFDQRFDGTTGVVLDSLQGDRDITGIQIENMRNGSFPTPLLNYRQAGLTVTLGGRDKVGDRDAIVLILEPRRGSIVRQYIDAESFLLVRSVMNVEVPELGQIEQTTELLDYRDVDGLNIPFRVSSSSAAQNIEVTITTVEHGLAINEALFARPAN
jgi:hypothetical protein